MAHPATELEFEDEWEVESESEFEDEDEDEAFLGALGGIARTVGGLLGGAGEGEWEDELEFEDEDEAFLGALGGIARTVGGLLGGDGEGEWEDELEFEDEQESEFEDEAEEFMRRVGRTFRRLSPILRVLAKTAGPLIATAVGGPAAGAVARVLTRQLEGEAEDEVGAEFEEMATAPLSGSRALAEYFAAQAASAQTESEAEAFAGVAAFSALSPRDRHDLERVLPALLRGAAVVTRLLHGNRRTRPALRLVPGIVEAAGRTLVRRSAAGQPIGNAHVGQVLGAATQRVFAGGRARQYVLRRHARGVVSARAHHRSRVRGSRTHPTRPRPAVGLRPNNAGIRRTARVVRRQPVRTQVTAVGPVARPRPGFVRVVTPVRVPPRGGRPGRTVRVVSDVRVPAGAVATGRPVSVSGNRRTR